MKLSQPIFALTLALALATPAHAQAPSTSSNGSASQAASRSYRLNWTVNEVDGSKHVSTQHFAMVVVVGGKSTLKIGSKVPVATGSYSDSGRSTGVQTQFQYLDIGLNIQASLEDVPGGVKLLSKVEQSSVAEDRTISGVTEPVIRQAVMEGTSLVEAGKPLTIGSLDVPGSTRHLEIEVVMEPVK